MARALISFMIIVVNAYRDLLVEHVIMTSVDVMIHSVEILVRVIWVLMVMLNAIAIKSIQVFSVKLVRRRDIPGNSIDCFHSGVHPCFPNPCTNGGTCVARGNKIACLCRHKFTGNQCEKRVDV